MSRAQSWCLNTPVRRSCGAIIRASPKEISLFLVWLHVSRPSGFRDNETGDVYVRMCSHSTGPYSCKKSRNLLGLICHDIRISGVSKIGHLGSSDTEMEGGGGCMCARAEMHHPTHDMWTSTFLSPNFPTSHNQNFQPNRPISLEIQKRGLHVHTCTEIPRP